MMPKRHRHWFSDRFVHTSRIHELSTAQNFFLSQKRRAAVGSVGFGMVSSDDSGNSVTSEDNGGSVTSGGGGGGVMSGGASNFLLQAAAAGPALSVPDPSMRRTDLMALHPVFRDAVNQLLEAFQKEGLPFRLFEAFRSPVRQAWLYSQGRPGGGSGPIVTHAEAWQSYHQYGLAADFVLWINGQWSWSTLGVNAGRWERLHKLGAKFGLETLNFETPHLQLAGLKIAGLQEGTFPSDSDTSWRDNLEGAIISWNGEPAAPQMVSVRPLLPEPTK